MLPSHNFSAPRGPRTVRQGNALRWERFVRLVMNLISPYEMSHDTDSISYALLPI